ncbi:hypothetical protein EZV62_021404 [Acer yangbiense]|uniref:Uncharacterized protein n=1 Tax=Acer yangbiense TaxID=1000413 RepID=A0A5C7H6K7_9ROSI|nr:hypothetical protein EZV62_021404 [Acer yangbiense]
MTLPAEPRVISSFPSTFTALLLFPQNPTVSKHKISSKRQNNLQNLRIQISRRDAVSLSFLSLAPPLLSQPEPANAFSFGISGPKDWLKEQKKKSSNFLLAPVDASRQILNSAYLLLVARESDYSEKDLEEIQGMLRSAARDCVPQERNSFVTFQANTGVEVCTFRLIVKNAASLLDNKDPAKLEAEAILNDLVRSFTSLNSLVGDTDIQISSKRYFGEFLCKLFLHAGLKSLQTYQLLDLFRLVNLSLMVVTQKLADALTDTISSLNKFEQGIKDCLEI